MGKSLIIKGADFAENCINDLIELTPLQGFATTNPENPNYGLLYLSLQSTPVLGNSITTKIFIPAGMSAVMYVKNYDTMLTDLNLGFIASQNDVGLVDGNIVTDIVLHNHPANDLFREDSGEFLIPNNTANDLYFYINFCYDVLQGPAFSVEGKRVFYELAY